MEAASTVWLVWLDVDDDVQVQGVHASQEGADKAAAEMSAETGGTAWIEQAKVEA